MSEKEQLFLSESAIAKRVLYGGMGSSSSSLCHLVCST